MVTQQTMADLHDLRTLAALAHSQHPFLTLYLNTEGETVPRNVQARLVDMLWSSAQAYQGTGVDAPLEALHNHELATLVLDPGIELSAALCPSCDRLASEAEVRCPVCEGEVETVDLREELPRHLHSGAVRLELVHGHAASVLREHGGIGGIHTH